MRILVVGAGATGGYFGGRLLEAGRDVRFLVRPGRAAQLAETGLVITSCFGNVTLTAPPTIVAGALHEHFDLVLLSCKAYDLAAAADGFAPAVGPNTVILPLLNGMRHLNLLDERFGADRVLGGACLISARLERAGRIAHLNDVHRIVFGERTGVRTPRVEALAEAMAGCRFQSYASDDIVHEMWQKWVFLAALAGATCLMRASVADIVGAGGANFLNALLEECRALATSAGSPPRPDFVERSRRLIMSPESTLIASMLGDIERGAQTEADHILGDLLRYANAACDAPLLRLAHTAVKSYEARSRRESQAPK